MSDAARVVVNGVPYVPEEHATLEAKRWLAIAAAHRDALVAIEEEVASASESEGRFARKDRLARILRLVRDELERARFL